jgi:hypothetical protein
MPVAADRLSRKVPSLRDFGTERSFLHKSIAPQSFFQPKKANELINNIK